MKGRLGRDAKDSTECVAVDAGRYYAEAFRQNSDCTGRACTHYANLSFNLASCLPTLHPLFPSEAESLLSRLLDYNLRRLRAIYLPATRE